LALILVLISIILVILRYSNMNKYSNICRCENIRSNNNVVGVAVNSSGSGSSSVSEGVHIIIFNF
jgi:hypothetical protein